MTDSPLVFLVDDDDAARDSLNVLLESHGFAVEVFASAHGLLERVGPGDKGCLVTDVRMPGMDGIELVQALAERAIRLPVVVITGHGDVPLAVRAMKAGALDFIEKPYDESAIVAAVQTALASLDHGVATDAAAADAKDRLTRLTSREHEVFELLVAGRPNKIIAYELGISPRTVEVHRARVMEKLQADSLSHLVRIGIMTGIGLRPC